MKARCLSVNLAQVIGEIVRVRGWIHTVRSLGKVHFLIVRDKKGLTQVVIEDPAEFAKLSGLQVGSVVTVIAEVASNPRANLGVELIHPQLTVEVAIHEAPSIDYTKPEIPSELDFILDHRALALRNSKLQAVFAIQAEMAHAYRCYMHDTVEAVEYFSPNLIGASSEGGAEFFNVDYFGHTATLAQSSQLYKQVMVGVNERVFALMPFFRAEKSHTSRHLSEGKQFEFEMGFFDHWYELMDIQEGAIKAILQQVPGIMIQAPHDIPFPRLTFAQVQQIYFERTGIDERDEDDLSPAAEKEVCQYALEQYGTEFVFVTDWKTSKRPFYSYPNDENPELTNTFDLLCAGTEITSGGQRRHTYASMLEGLALKGLDPIHFEDYLSIFKYGMPVHGGFGMGLERLTMTVLKLKNIREASLFPSDTKRIAGNRIKAHVFFGMENIRNEIIRLLKANAMSYDFGTEFSTQALGIKALILRGKQSKKNYQFNLPVSAKIDMKKVAELVQEKCEFEDAAVIKERFGLEVGGIPPLGQLLNLETFYDESLQSAGLVSFHCGLVSERIEMQAAELLQLAAPQFAAFALR
jgi:nondiscriminating aspartyl-tRNA synthetase